MEPPSSSYPQNPSNGRFRPTSAPRVSPGMDFRIYHDPIRMKWGASHCPDCSRHVCFRHRHRDTYKHPQSLFWVTMTLECAHCCSAGSKECPGHLGGDQTRPNLSHAHSCLSVQKALSPSWPPEGPHSRIKACARGIVWLPGGGNPHPGARAATVLQGQGRGSH